MKRASANRKQRREIERREAHARRTGQWGDWEEVSREQVEVTLRGHTGWVLETERVWRNRVFSVLLRSVDTEWGTVLHLAVSTGANAQIGWAELQRIKNELMGPDRTAVEVYPKAAATTDEANMYHLWVLPEGFDLPFGLPSAWNVRRRLVAAAVVVADSLAVGDAERAAEERRKR